MSTKHGAISWSGMVLLMTTNAAAQVGTDIAVLECKPLTYTMLHSPRVPQKNNVEGAPCTEAACGKVRHLSTEEFSASEAALEYQKEFRDGNWTVTQIFTISRISGNYTYSSKQVMTDTPDFYFYTRIYGVCEKVNVKKKF